MEQTNQHEYLKWVLIIGDTSVYNFIVLKLIVSLALHMKETYQEKVCSATRLNDRAIWVYMNPQNF